jgi:hypothetical protein
MILIDRIKILIRYILYYLTCLFNKKEKAIHEKKARHEKREKHEKKARHEKGKRHKKKERHTINLSQINIQQYKEAMFINYELYKKKNKILEIKNYKPFAYEIKDYKPSICEIENQKPFT